MRVIGQDIEPANFALQRRSLRVPYGVPAIKQLHLSRSSSQSILNFQIIFIPRYIAFSRAELTTCMPSSGQKERRCTSKGVKPRLHTRCTCRSSWLLWRVAEDEPPSIVLSRWSSAKNTSHFVDLTLGRTTLLVLYSSFFVEAKVNWLWPLIEHQRRYPFVRIPSTMIFHSSFFKLCSFREILILYTRSRYLFYFSFFFFLLQARGTAFTGNEITLIAVLSY